MVTMRDVANPVALKWTLGRTNTDEKDVVVISVRMMAWAVLNSESRATELQRTRADVFTKAVSVAESFGKKVSLLVVPAAMCLRRWRRAPILLKWIQWSRAFPRR